MKLYTYRLIGLATLIGAIIFVVSTQSSTTEYQRATSTGAQITQVAPEVDVVEKARRALEEQTKVLKDSEDNSLAIVANASSTRDTDVSTANSEYEKVVADAKAKRDMLVSEAEARFTAIKEVEDKNIDRINSIRSSF